MPRIFSAAALLLFASIATADTYSPEEFKKVVAAVQGMQSDTCAVKLATDAGLSIQSVAWEDTARAHGSSVGPNISDVRLQVRIKNDAGEVEAVETMPVIRANNFIDRTVDLPPSAFHVLVGNEKGAELKPVSLTEYLDNLPNYLSDESSWADGAGKTRKSLWVPRDSHVLVSAQASLLPIPRGSAATVEFNPVIFNYQSSKENPAVLAIVATAKGTSATIIDNTRDVFQNGRSHSPGQQLFHNQKGERAAFVGQRLSAHAAAGGNVDAPSIGANQASGADVVTLIQVPLKHTPTVGMVWGGLEMLSFGSRSVRGSGMEKAAVSFGKVEGPFTEMDGLAIERDPRFPIRVTTMFYNAVDSAALDPEELRGIEASIASVYNNAAAAGSLVVDGPQGRPTEHGVHQWKRPSWWPIAFPAPEPLRAGTISVPAWWNELPALSKLQITPAEAFEGMQQIYGADFLRVIDSPESANAAVEYLAEVINSP